jgi:hypothetical protein
MKLHQALLEKFQDLSHMCTLRCYGRCCKVNITNTAQEQAQRSSSRICSPMQEEAFRQVAALKIPEQYGQGSQFVTSGGIGSLDLSGRAAGVGQDYYRMATDPGAQAAFMSPYMQNVVDRQKLEANRDFTKQLSAQRAQSAGAGAFGGSRSAIAQSEAQRNLNQQLQNIQAAGTQQAFQQAQQAQQFGANLGLQGLGAGYQGLGMGMQGAGVGLSGLGTALQGQQARMAGLGQAGQFYGQGMQGAGVGLQGVGAQQAAGQLGLAGTAQGIQGAQAGLGGVGQAIGAGQYGLQGLGAATQATALRDATTCCSTRDYWATVSSWCAATALEQATN